MVALAPSPATSSDPLHGTGRDLLSDDGAVLLDDAGAVLLEDGEPPPAAWALARSWAAPPAGLVVAGRAHAAVAVLVTAPPRVPAEIGRAHV